MLAGGGAVVTGVLSVLLWLLPALVALPVLVLALQVGAAWPRRSDGLPLQMPSACEGPAPRIAVLVPAHDEAMVIARTVQRLRAALTPHDVLCVVADNCSDDTARLARDAGAQVVERFDAQRRGKGYALDHGVRHLATLEQAPDALLIIDADCTVATANGLHGLARLALDLAVPPLALLVLLLLAVCALAGGAALLGWGWVPLAAALVCLTLLAMAVGMAWWGWGRAVVSARDLCSVPFYVLAKLPVYAGYLFKRQKEWVRTDRK